MAQPAELIDSKTLSHIYPGRGLGWMTDIGASLYDILSRLKAHPQLYPYLDLSYSSTQPILEPIVVDLPSNGLRLRFDGPDQRLRLIEIIDFSKTTFVYKNTEVVRRPSSDEPAVSGPGFRHIYNRLFGPAYAGEYSPPATGHSNGTYVLSYPGLAVRFDLKHKLWSDKADFVSLLATAASPATSIAIFSGNSWPDVRDTLYTKTLSLPRSLVHNSKIVESVADEVESVVIHGGGCLELVRRILPPFMIRLNQTTPQNLIAELGPPDAIFRKNPSRLSIHAASRNTSTSPSLQPNSRHRNRSSSHSLNGGDDDSDSELEDNGEEKEMFYNYFHHGFDILISHQSTSSPAFPGNDSDIGPKDQKLVSTKVFLHANIPGSYSFNRHRRSRWSIVLPDDSTELDSEMCFSDISSTLKETWKEYYSSASEQESFERGMVLNRDWGESPESSIELLGEMDDSAMMHQTTHNTFGGTNSAISSNTHLFGFPGMLFEVVKGDLVSCVTIY